MLFVQFGVRHYSSIVGCRRNCWRWVECWNFQGRFWCWSRAFCTYISRIFSYGRNLFQTKFLNNTKKAARSCKSRNQFRPQNSMSSLLKAKVDPVAHDDFKKLILNFIFPLPSLKGEQQTKLIGIPIKIHWKANGKELTPNRLYSQAMMFQLRG